MARYTGTKAKLMDENKPRLEGLRPEDFHKWYAEQKQAQQAEAYKKIKAEQARARAKVKAIANTRSPKKVAQMERRRTKAPKRRKK